MGSGEGMTPKIILMTAVYFPLGEAGYIRKQGFRESLTSWHMNLAYDGELSLMVVNDGPALPLWSEWHGHQIALGHERNGLGASFNLGFREALKRTPLVCNIVDDAILGQRFDLTPWARMLLDDEAIGAVRLSSPYPGCTGTIEPRKHGWVVRMNRHNLVAGLRPSLYHQRFFEAYGYFDEHLTAWETERLYNERFCQRQGPETVLALVIPWSQGKGAEVMLGQMGPTA